MGVRTKYHFVAVFLLIFYITGIDTKSESDSNTDGEMTSSFPHEDAAQLAHEKSEETYKEWGKYWNVVQLTGSEGIMKVTEGESAFV